MVFFQKEKQKSLDQVMKITLIRQFVFYGFKRGNINRLIKHVVNLANYIECKFMVVKLNIIYFS